MEKPWPQIAKASIALGERAVDMLIARNCELERLRRLMWRLISTWKKHRDPSKLQDIIDEIESELLKPK